MNGRIAKQLRNKIFAKKDFRDRQYTLTKNKSIITVEKDMKVSRRRIYQKMKDKITCKKLLLSEVAILLEKV